MRGRQIKKQFIQLTAGSVNRRTKYIASQEVGSPPLLQGMQGPLVKQKFKASSFPLRRVGSRRESKRRDGYNRIFAIAHRNEEMSRDPHRGSGSGSDVKPLLPRRSRKSRRTVQVAGLSYASPRDRRDVCGGILSFGLQGIQLEGYKNGPFPVHALRAAVSGRRPSAFGLCRGIP